MTMTSRLIKPQLPHVLYSTVATTCAAFVDLLSVKAVFFHFRKVQGSERDMNPSCEQMRGNFGNASHAPASLVLDNSSS